MKRKLLFVLLMIVLASGIRAQESTMDLHAEKEMTAEEVVAAYFKSIGGVTNWAAVYSMKLAGTVVQGNRTFPATVYVMRPARRKVVADLMNKQYVDCYNDGDGWFINPFMGVEKPRRKTDRQLSLEPYQEFCPFMAYEEKGYEVEYRGRAEVNGRLTHELLLRKGNEGGEYFYFFDEELFVPVLMRTFVQSEEGIDLVVEIYFSDYEEVDGLLVAHSIEQRIQGQVVLQITADVIVFNDPEITPEIFAFPAGERK